MEHLWSPWRLAYITGEASSGGCVFCAALSDPEAEPLIVHRGAACFVILNLFPYNNGHLMVAPRAHVASLTDLGDDQTAAVMTLVRRSLRMLDGVMQPQGFNVGVNIGRVAGAGFPDHVHVHIVPRWDGDTNFLPVVAEVKVVNEHLDRTWEKLSQAFAAS